MRIVLISTYDLGRQPLRVSGRPQPGRERRAIAVVLGAHLVSHDEPPARALGGAEVDDAAGVAAAQRPPVDGGHSVGDRHVVARYADRLPVQVRRGFLAGGLPVPEGMDATYRASFARMLEMTKLLHDRGIRIVAGTEALLGRVSLA